MAAEDFDAIVVGARCGGAATAMLLGRRGYRVLLVDRARFPSDVPHGHALHRDGPRRLRDWGLLDRLIGAGTPPIETAVTDFGDFPLVARDLVVDGVAWAYGARRRVFDEILVEAAVVAGAEFREGFTVDALTFDSSNGARVTGIRGRGDGREVTERATITIGADGRNSRVARLAGAPIYDAHPPLLCYYFSYWSGLPVEGLEILDADRRLIFAFPTNDGLTGVFFAWPVQQFHEVRADIEGHVLAAADRFPRFAERLHAATREERFSGTADLPNFFRRPHGDGWALVGDAGYHKDPYLALGMADALRDAELLADAIDAGLSGRQPLPDALAAYEQRRNALSRPEYEENLALARMAPKPVELMALRVALRDDPVETRRFWMARVGMIPREQFFNPEHLGRVMARVAPGRPTASTPSAVG